MTFQDITHPDDLETDLNFVEQMLAGEIRTYQMEKRYIHRLGHPVWVLLGVSLVRTQDGAPLHFISQIQDITERKRAEEELASSRARLAEAQRIAQIGDWRRGSDNQPLTWSQETFRIFGIDPSEGPPSFDRLLAMVHPDDRENFDRAVKHCRKDGKPYSHEYRVVLADGTVRWVHGSGELVDGEGPYGVTRGTAQDITERKRAEEERDRLREELHHAQKLEAVGRLAGGVAHDFNNMLTAIKGYSELLLSGLPPESPLRSEAEQIHRAALQAAALPRQLLAFSRKQLLEPRLVDLNEVVFEATDLIRLLLGEKVELVTKPLARPPAVVADPGQVEQVLINLAINARDAMPDGGTLTISTYNADVGEQDAREHEASPAATSSSRSRTPARGWTERRSRGSSSHSSPPRAPARARASASPRPTASRGRAEDSSRRAASRAGERRSTSTSLWPSPKSPQPRCLPPRRRPGHPIRRSSCWSRTRSSCAASRRRRWSVPGTGC